MRMVTFGIASLLAAVSLLWLAATHYRRSAASGEGGTMPDEGAALSVGLCYTLGAVFAVTHPPIACVAFVLAALVGVGIGLVSEAGELLVLGASAALPAAGSLLSMRRR